jgi:hypothetical protein
MFMFERIEVRSREQLRQLIRQHGLQQIIDTAREIVREDAAARLAMPPHREVVTGNVAQVVAGKVPER